MSKRPDWVPQWIWECYLEIPALPNDVHTKMRAALMADPGCAVVWKAMDRRRGKTVFSGEDSETLLVDFEASVVLWRAPVFAGGLTPEDLVPAAIRRRNGKKIANLASQLLSVLNSVRIGPAEWPRQFGTDLSNSVASRYMASDCPRWLATVALEPDQSIEELCDMLELIQRPALSWATWISAVPQPKAPDAGRLNFIRNMTCSFRSMYNTPLRECVAAMTRCLFECDIDAATVAKLAR